MLLVHGHPLSALFCQQLLHLGQHPLAVCLCEFYYGSSSGCNHNSEYGKLSKKACPSWTGHAWKHIPLNQWWYELGRKGWCMVPQEIHCKPACCKWATIIHTSAHELPTSNPHHICKTSLPKATNAWKLFQCESWFVSHRDDPGTFAAVFRKCSLL